MGNRNRNKSTPKPMTDSHASESLLAKIILALIAAIAAIIVATIGYFASLKSVILPIEATQTAESRLTAIAISTQTAETFYSSVAATQTTDAAVTSFATTQTASWLETFIAATQTIEAVETETSIAMTKNAEAVVTSIAMTQTAETSRTAIAMTNQAAKLPVNTPLPPSSYGGLTFDCMPTAYWQINSKSNSGNCLDVRNSELSSNDRAFEVFIMNSPTLEKIVSMDISKLANLDVSFSVVVEKISGDIKVSYPKLGVGICNPKKPLFEHTFIY